MVTPEAPLASRIHGLGEMADRIRHHRWEQTSLGPIATWPAELVTMVNMMLASKIPTTIQWGPEMLVFYNDPFIPNLQGKHPATLGSPFRVVWAEAYHLVADIFARPFETGEAFSIPATPFDLLLDGKNTRKYYSYAGNPIWCETPDGPKVQGIYQTATDETDAFTTQQQLRESEVQANRILESIGDAVIVTDANANITHMNPVAEVLTGWSNAAAQGKPLAEIFRIVNENTRETVDNPAEKVRREGTVVGLANHSVLIGKDGQETHIDDSAAPIRNDAGDLAGVVLVFRDVQERRDAERKRELLAEQLMQIQEATTDAIFTVDRDWKVTYLNGPAKKVTGPLSETLGKNVWEQYPDMVYADSPYVEHYQRAMNEGIGGEFEAYYPEPLNIWVHVRACPTRDGIVVFFQDVSERRRAQAALLQTEKLAAVGRLSASIAHEINNPLESVTNLLYLARRSNSQDEIQDHLDTAERELRRVSVISSQTLRFHKQASKPAQATCEDLFGSALDIYLGRLVNSHIQLEKRKRAVRSVECFDGEIRQVLNNLMGNAIDAMHPGGGRLLLRSRDGHNWRTGHAGLVLTVADTGQGMAPATLKKIFEAFYTTKGIGGTGLGLWVSQEIVARHHGKLLVRSSQSQSHHGTVFTLFLPFEAVVRRN